MDEFAQNPTMDKLERCTKADLFLIASFFDVSIPLNARKVEIKSCLSQRLVEKGVIKVAKLQSVPVSGGLNVEVGAAAATATQAPSGQDKTESPLAAKPVKNVSMNLLPAEAELAFDVDRSAFIAAQQSDPTLVTCLALATAPSSETPRVCAGDSLDDRDVAPAGLAERGARPSVSTVADWITSVTSPLPDWWSKGLGLHNAGHTEARALSYMAAAHCIVLWFCN
ncbi:hypothetical protein ABVT39_001013 [Epinephelus coioides]